MPSEPSKPASDGLSFIDEETGGRVFWGPVILSALVLLWFYGFEKRFFEGSVSSFGWIWSAWNDDLDYEHGPLFPLVIAGLIVYRFKAMKAAVGEGSMWGVAVVLLGALFFAAGYRTLQPRVTMGALPILLWGGALSLWGWNLARMLVFPLFFFWLAIPLPSFQQATNGLQILAVSMAHHGASMFGVETIVQGTKIASVHGNWEPLEIAKGCSGIRSLMALLMISGAWSYVANMAMWKRVLLFFSAVPLAILGNALRVISIFVIGEYGNPTWARGTWHDWSGLLLFYPISLFLLLVIHSLLEGGLPWRKGKVKQVRRVVVTRTEDSASNSEPA